MTSYTMMAPSPPRDRNGFKVAIICALPLEAEMVQATFERNWMIKYGKAPGDSNVYTTGMIGDHNVVLTHMAEMGGNNAAAAAARLQTSFRKVEVVFLVGVCGAAPIHPETKEEVILGDCIISTALIQYDFGRRLPDGFSRKRGVEDCLSRPIPEVRAMISKLKISQNRNYLGERLLYHLEDLQRTHHVEYPGPGLDRLYNPTYSHKHHDRENACSDCSKDDGSCYLDCVALNCSDSELVYRSRLDNSQYPSGQHPKIHFGRIGSANSIMKSGTTRDNLANIDKIVGFEMEGAGLWDIFPTILLKSVCDYADSHKNKGWQRYAAASSAACLKALFEQWEVSESSPTESSVPIGNNASWMGYGQSPNIMTAPPTKELDQWSLNNHARMNPLQTLSFQHIAINNPTMYANLLPLGYENPSTAMLTNALIQQPKSLAYQLNEINTVLRSPPYEDPLTHNSSVRLESTCNWIFDRAFYQEWLRTTSPQTTPFLWLYAGAGSGKTILCTSIILSLKNDPHLNVFHYFSSAHVQSRADLSSIIRYWITETARHNQVMLEYIYKELYQEGRGRMVSAADAWNLFGRILTHLRGCVFILDGLDEYDVASRQEFLINLKSQLAWKSAKVLITSRDESDIRIELGSSSADTPGLSFSSYQFAKSDTQSDISLLSNSIINRKLPRQDTSFRSKLATSLTERSDGMFLWVKLASQRLNGGQSQAALGRIVDKAPAGLNSVYEHKWQTIIQQPDEEEKLRAINILRWCTFAVTPLTVAQLVEALAVSLTDDRNELDRHELPDEIDEDFVNHGIKGLCGSFVELRADDSDQAISEQTVHLIHGSIKDFLLEVLPEKGTQPSSMVTDVVESTQHLELSKICLRYLCYKNTVAGSILENGLSCEFRQYALEQWCEHQAISQIEDPEFTQLALQFLNEKNQNFMDWSSALMYPNVYQKTFEHGPALPFYYAAVLGLVSVLEEMHLDMADSVDSVGGLWGTALQAACARGQHAALDLLLSWKADPNMEAGLYGTALIASVMHGQPKITEQLLSHGANPKQQNRHGHTAVFLGAGWNSSECIRILLEKRPDTLDSFEGKATPLVNAADNGHHDVVKLLLDHGAEINVHSEGKWTALMVAASRGHVNVAGLLLERGADIEAINIYLHTALMCASDHGQYEVVKLLIDHGANVAASDLDGWTSLYWAAKAGNTEICKFLLDHGADIAASDSERWTSLHRAVCHDNLDVCRLLLNHGADIAAPTIHKSTPLHIAAQNDGIDTIKLLLEYGADPRAINGALDLPVNSAIRHASLQTVALLLEKSGLDVYHYSTPSGKTLLHEAARRGDVEIYNHVSAQNLDPGLKDAYGNGILKFCCISGSKELLEKILQTEDTNSINIESTYSWSPLHWVCREGSFDMIRLLDAAGIVFFPITTSWPQTTWTPLDIARFCGNSNLVTDDGELNANHPWEQVRNCGIVEIDKSSNLAKGLFKSAPGPIATRSEAFRCDGCDSDIFGPRFRCLNCTDFDYCFMCKHTAEQKDIHSDHEWKCIDPPDGPNP